MATDNDSKVFNERGSLLLFRKATQEDIDLMLKLMSSDKYEFLTILRTIIDDDRDMLKLLDMMSGAKVTFPERKKIYKTLEKIFIYKYVASRNFSQQSYVAIAKMYDKRVTQVKLIVETMSKFLSKDKLSSDEIDSLGEDLEDDD